MNIEKIKKVAAETAIKFFQRERDEFGLRRALERFLHKFGAEPEYLAEKRSPEQFKEMRRKLESSPALIFPITHRPSICRLFC